VSSSCLPRYDSDREATADAAAPFRITDFIVVTTRW
jgi:hypothetical protein